MALISRIQLLNCTLRRLVGQVTTRNNVNLQHRGVHFRSGAFKPQPMQQTLGLVGVFCAVVPGLFIGATISKNVANFLEENDLFVPSDDDDDDD